MLQDIAKQFLEQKKKFRAKKEIKLTHVHIWHVLVQLPTFVSGWNMLNIPLACNHVNSVDTFKKIVQFICCKCWWHCPFLIEKNQCSYPAINLLSCGWLRHVCYLSVKTKLRIKRLGGTNMFGWKSKFVNKKGYTQQVSNNNQVLYLISWSPLPISTIWR